MRCYCGETVKDLQDMAEHILADIEKHSAGSIAWAKGYAKRRKTFKKLMSKEDFYKDMLEKEKEMGISKSL
jgi:hypothetical protein